MRRLREILAASRPELRGWRVLVVEDNPDDMVILVRLLSTYPCVVNEADCADVAVVELANAEPYDLCFLDLRLDGARRGVDVVRAVRPLRPDTRFVLVTGYDEMSQVREMEEVGGVFTMLFKPVRREDLDYIFSATPG